MLAATALTSVISAMTIVIHYEAISFVHRWHAMPYFGVRVRAVLGVFVLFAAHAVEIWLFAIGIHIAKDVFAMGSLEGAFDGSIRDYLYFSVVTYASVGYGDIRPTGDIRTICGFEALTGILMMAWSAAYTSFRLEELWRGRG